VSQAVATPAATKAFVAKIAALFNG